MNMTTATGVGAGAHDDSLCATDTASHMNVSPLKDSLHPRPLERQLSDSSATSSSTLSSARGIDSNLSVGGHFLLPIPNPGSNKSQSSFALSDDENHSVVLDPLPGEIANADISIAHDGSFVETSSGAAARELKKRYDEHLGVRDASRSSYTISPFAITAFVNQHGKQMYRVGRRELSPPALSASDDAERQIVHHKSPSQSTSKSPKRRSRMSMHAFLPPSMFKNGSSTPPKMPIGMNDVTRSPPLRKLRKARSLTNMLVVANSIPPEVVSGPSTTTTGRPHAHSVTGADLPRMPVLPINMSDPYTRLPPRRDVFGDVMQWGPISHIPSSVSNSTDSDDPAEPSPTIPHPFSRGVTFDSPSHRSFPQHLVTPHVLREMQSFESGLTARADPEPRKVEKANLSVRTSFDRDQEREREQPITPIPTRCTVDIRASPSLESSMHSRYCTGVFDVLQNYRGLPLLDRLSPDSNETTVIKLSTGSDTSAAPRDDPRFVIWGEIYPDEDDGLDAMSLSHESRTDLSSHSGPSRRNMKRKSPAPSPLDPPNVRVTVGDTPQKALVAATIERWIAQLTSELNYDELLILFLTYRTYVSAVDLCHLLICRFHWAVEPCVMPQDDIVKKIVRVRTFIAIRYWLLTFFTVDFVPNRELRLLFANWLNTLSRDPTLENTKDVLDIVRKLKKVAKECKDAQTTKSRSTAARRPSTARRSGSAPDGDSDVDLDFLPDGGFEYSGPQSFGVNSPMSATLSADMAILQQPLHLAILQHSKQSTDTKVNGPFVPSAATLPFHHGALSRVFVNTIGRLGRWKRVLNSRHNVQDANAATADVSPFDLEPNATGDLLTVRGGVEQYLKMIEPQMPKSPSTGSSSVASSLSLPVTPGKDGNLPLPVTDTTAVRKLSEPLHVVCEESEAELDTQSICIVEEVIPSYDRSISPQSYDSDMSRRQTFDSLIESSRLQQSGRPQIDVVSIDELELSDMSSNEDQEEPEACSALRKVGKKLPLRRDFEFVRRPVESLSSFGTRTRDSVASAASSSVASSGSAGPELGSTIQQWQVNALVDSLSDDEEAGDVDAALRHLEGRISRVKQVVKQSKVDTWVKSIRERIVLGDYGDERPRFPVDDDDDETSGCDVGEFGALEDDSSISGRPPVAVASHNRDSVPHTASDVDTPLPDQHFQASQSMPGSPVRNTDVIPTIEDAVPLEILRSRVASRPSTSDGSVSSPSVPNLHSLKTRTSSVFIGLQGAPKLHRSVFLGHRSAVLAEHFATIERELFMALKFEELVVDDWMQSVEEANVLDWAQFLKDRARYKAEARGGPKTSALVTFRGRFNLCANFVISEVILTHPTERPVIVGKFIRIAWKLYERGSFNTLVSIIAGLRSDWVARAMHKLWNRVGMWENRMFQDLTAVTSPGGNFKFLRQEVEAAIEAKPIFVGPHDISAISTDGQSSTTSRKAAGDGKVQPRPACIPFLGIYLSQLYRHSQLPDLIDPTSPNKPVGIDPITNAFEAPAHPEVFSTLSPLPPSMQLEPLINVQKQRLIAGVIKCLVTGQHLASKIQYSVDKKLFQKCLKLKALDEDTLQRAYAMYPE